MKKLSRASFTKRRANRARSASCAVSTTRIKRIPRLLNGNIQSFRDEAFEPARPCLFPAGHFSYLPAAGKWFEPPITPPALDAQTRINVPYLTPHGATILPLEITRPVGPQSSLPQFERLDVPLAFFLTYLQTHQAADNEKAAAMPSLYLAQAPLASLPPALNDDLPTPELVLQAGRGDIYDSSIWIGPAPTFTPLHRDPNPNLFVQLAGRKMVRMFEPDIGQEVFTMVRAKTEAQAGGETLRGEEMMMGEERQLLDEAVWGDCKIGKTHTFEAELCPGDGLFIPLGWWHSIKGIGKGIIGSVNWWFR